MYPMYSFTEKHPLHKDDVQGIQHLYGEGVGQGWREERERLGREYPENAEEGKVRTTNIYLLETLANGYNCCQVSAWRW